MISFVTLDKCNIMTGFDAQHSKQIQFVSPNVNSFSIVLEELVVGRNGVFLSKATTTQTTNWSIRYWWRWWWRTALITIEEIIPGVLLMIGLATLITHYLHQSVVQHDLSIGNDVSVWTLRSFVPRSDQDEKRWDRGELGWNLSKWVAKDGTDVDGTEIVYIGIEHFPFSSWMKQIKRLSRGTEHGRSMSTYRECCWWHSRDPVLEVDLVGVFWWVHSGRVFRMLEETRLDLFPFLGRMDLLLLDWVHHADGTWHHLVTSKVMWRNMSKCMSEGGIHTSNEPFLRAKNIDDIVTKACL